MKNGQSRVLKNVLLTELKVNARNPRRHTRAQIAAIAKSIKAFGFNAPILIDKYGNIIAGHGRFEAAILLGLTEVPVICLDDLSDAEARAYMLADNRLTDRSSWDQQALAVHLKELTELTLEFSIEATGFETPEINLRVQSLDDKPESDADDAFSFCAGPAVSCLDDLWNCGDHKLVCGDARDAECYAAGMGGELAAVVFTCPPNRLTFVAPEFGLGGDPKFAQACGETTASAYTQFLSASLALVSAHLAPGALVYMGVEFLDMSQLQGAAKSAGLELLDGCVWVKPRCGTGPVYRSKHALISVFVNGSRLQINKTKLDRPRGNRSSVWSYGRTPIRPRKRDEGLLALQTAAMPVSLVADAMRDSTKRGELVLDPFVGSGTSILAAERSGRRCCGIELEPRRVDTAITRWERMTGRKATHANGKTFAEIAAERVPDHV